MYYIKFSQLSHANDVHMCKNVCCCCCFSLRQMRAKVWKLRLVSQLFNTKKYAADLESLYHTIWRNREKGLPINHVKALPAGGAKAVVATE